MTYSEREREFTFANKMIAREHAGSADIRQGKSGLDTGSIVVRIQSPDSKPEYSIRIRWTNVQAIDVKFFSGFHTPKIIKIVYFLTELLEKYKGGRFLGHSVCVGKLG